MEKIEGTVQELKDLQGDFKAETNANIESKIRPFQEKINSINFKVTKFKGIIQELEDAKAKTVVFNAIRIIGGNFKGDITYDVVPTNVRNVMDAATGVFTAPFDASYFFTLSGISPYSEENFFIIFVKNGVDCANR